MQRLARDDRFVGTAPPRARSTISFREAVNGVVCLLVILACQERGSGRLTAFPTMGPVDTGEWHVTSTTFTDTCHLGSAVQPFQGYYAIHLMDDSASVISFCCEIPVQPGTRHGSAVLFQRLWTIKSSDTCSWNITEVDLGTLDPFGFSGTSSLSVSAVGDCGPGFPCEIDADFTGDHCPTSTGCGVVCTQLCPL
jgi:hypothetical protein